MSALLHLTGGDNGTGVPYLELSGFLSIILPPLLTMIGALILLWWHSRCHVQNCLKHGKYPFHHYKLCHKHHPHVPQAGITHLHVVKLHKGNESGKQR